MNMGKNVMGMKRGFGFLVLLISVILVSVNLSMAQQRERTDKNNENSGVIGTRQGEGENKAAKELALDLMKRLDLTLEQTQKVQDILTDYHEDLAGYRDDRNRRAETDRDNTGIVRDNNAERRNAAKDREDGMVADDNDQNDFAKKLSDIDVSANDKIEDIVDDEKRPEYNRVKKNWWSKVKKDVYARNVGRDEEEGSVTEGAKNVKNRAEETANKVTGDKETGEAGTEESKENIFAREMAMSLMKELELSLNQAADIQKVLVDYQNDIAEARMDMFEDRNVAADNRAERDDDRNGMTGGNVNEKLRDLDESVNEDIESVLTDNQKSKYQQVKKQWWSKVKASFAAHK